MKISNVQDPEDTKDFQSFLSILSQHPSTSIHIPETLIYKNDKPTSFTYTAPNNLLKFTQKIKPNEIASLIIRKVRQRSINESVLIRKEVASIQLLSKHTEIITNEKLVNLLLTKSSQNSFPGLYMVQGLVNFSYSLTVNYPTDVEVPLKIVEILKIIEENLKLKNWSLHKAEFKFVFADGGQCFLVQGEGIVMSKNLVKVDAANLTQYRMSSSIRKDFLQSLDYHAANMRSKRLLSLQNVMNEHYEKIKEELNIDQALNTVFHLEVPRKTLPFLAEEKNLKERTLGAFVTDDARNTIRTIRRLSVFQSDEFKMMKSSQRKRGRSIFE